MLVSADIAERSDQMVSACGLDTLSIFFTDRSANSETVTYLHHCGVSPAAQYAYQHGRVFRHDPFTRIVDQSDRSGKLIWWEDRRLSSAARSAEHYKSFINYYSVDVVGAWVQQLLPDFILVIGAHCRNGSHHKGDVARRLFQHEISAISQMVVGQLLEETLSGAGGRGLLQSVLSENRQWSPDDAMTALSPREREIAKLVSAGNQNKQVAYMTGISEFTVENHLRKIYRKLGVRNRAAMTARIHSATTYQ
mgnify:CR=1 FL=1